MQACDVTSQNSRMIVCSIQNDGTAGANNVSVSIPGKGLAAVQNDTTQITAYINPLNIIALAPAAISTLGGADVTISGRLLVALYQSEVEPTFQSLHYVSMSFLDGSRLLQFLVTHWRMNCQKLCTFLSKTAFVFLAGQMFSRNPEQPFTAAVESLLDSEGCITCFLFAEASHCHRFQHHCFRISTER